MQLEDYFDFLTEDDIRLKGTRVGIETILYEYVHCSQRPEAIAQRYPSLTLEQVFATLTWYLHNKEAVDAYLVRWLQHGHNMRKQQEENPSAAVRRFRKIKMEQSGTQDAMASEAIG